MKGLLAIPSTEDLLAAYERLQRRDAAPEPGEIAFWSQWARFDPRLGEQIVAFLSLKWREINPLLLRERLLEQPWPQALAVLLQQALDTGLVARAERALFRSWRGLVVSGIGPAPGEQFFIGLRKLGGKQMRLDAERPIRSYSRWGYVSREILVNKARASGAGRARTLLPVKTRKRVLAELMRERERITVADYREALGGCVSRRQAELDLASERGLRAFGNTRARVYRRTRSR